MLRKSALLLTICLGLAACESPEERAEGYYQSALSLLEEGDRDRALIELRNVFDYDGVNIEARRLYAKLLLEDGDARQAYSQYLRLVEQAPNDLELRVEVADLAVDFGDWGEVKRHADAMLNMAPDQLEPRAYALMLDYRNARLARDDITAGEIVPEARALLEENPELTVAGRIMIDWLATSPEPERALPYIDSILERRPDALSLHMDRLQILARVERNEDVEAQLREMYDRFPENAEISDMIIRWYVGREDFASVEAFLRERAGADDENFEEHISIVQLLQRVEGVEAAVAELERLASANAGTELGQRYDLVRIGLEFDPALPEDVKAARIQALVDLIADIESTDLGNEARIELVRMRGAQGDVAGAKAVVDEILESDSSNVQALLLRSAWLIQDEVYGEAITDLRLALDQAPRNADALLLLAEAHQKLGNVALAEQRLARAVEVSGQAPRETLIFARFQIGQGNLGAAQQALNESLRVNGNLEVARLLGQVLLRRGEFDDLATLIAGLSGNDSPEVEALAQSLQAAMLFNQNRIEESLDFLRSTRDETDENSSFETDVQILRVQMMSGRLDEAREQLQKLRSQYPDSLALRLLQGNILSLEGNASAAIAVYRQILEENPDELLVIQRLYAALQESGQQDAASDLLVQALDTQPEARNLMSLRAIELEGDGEYEQAIAIYEELYARNPNDVAVANNLASVLAYYRQSEADLDRAHLIGQRLAGSNLPEFQDTLGYIQLRRGEVNEAILNLQAAARGLPDNATVAFNLALAYDEAGRTDAAREELVRGFELAGNRTDIPQLGLARILERRLSADPEDAGTDDGG